ncbi:MAG: argininosuccinate lyase [Methanolinea sp.]|nr:argininosuccinate lyase [Methanolinea sp.]
MEMIPEDVVRRGRLRGDRTGEMMHFLSSMKADRYIADADILVDIAHVLMLYRRHIIPRETARDLLRALLRLYDDGIPDSIFDDRFEDVHAGIESHLVSVLGEETGGRLHIGRSRNDEVATCLRMKVREDITRQLAILVSLRTVLLDHAEGHVGTVMPGFTHLQHAQPTTLAHHLLAHEAAFARDFARLSDAYARTNLCPLGAAAFASTSYPIDRALVASLLGFDGILENTMDAVASRDFALEVMADLSILMSHASRLCEELVVWSSQFVQFVDLDDAFCSTSSIMPQKKNPDSAEIMRAKAGSVFGALASAFSICKALPMSYNRDLQELTPALLAAIHDTKHSTRILVDMLATARFNVERMAAEAGKGYTTATDLADILVQKYGMPFRRAHTLVGKAISRGALDLPALDRAAEEEGLAKPSALGLTQEEVAAALDVTSAVDRRRAPGAPSPFAVKVSLAERRVALEEDSAFLEGRRAALSEAQRRLLEDARKEAGT